MKIGKYDGKGEKYSPGEYWPEVSRARAPRPPWPLVVEESPGPIEEVLPQEILTEVRDTLRRDWFMIQRDEYRIQLGQIWSPPHEMHPKYEMLSLDSVLSIPGKRSPRIPYIDKRREYLLYNKAAVFYWMQSAFPESARAGQVILGSVWNTWFDALGREPQIPLDEFFAVPISVGEKEARTVSGIARSHGYICAQVRQTLQADESVAG